MIHILKTQYPTGLRLPSRSNFKLRFRDRPYDCLPFEGRGIKTYLIQNKRKIKNDA
jgi:hypothetical protein